MFETKYTVSIINSKWERIKNNLKLKVIPRRDELIFFDDKYHTVLNVVHMLNKKQDIYIIINVLAQQPKEVENE